MKNKYVAAALAFFLGGLGVHKFYLGKTWQGILYLVFCWTYIPAILGLIESIMYLVMDQRKFNEQYNNQAGNIPEYTEYEEAEVVSSKPQRAQSIPEKTQETSTTYKRKNRFLPDEEQVEAKSDKKICPKCGAENDIENNFCESCGTKLS